MARSQAPIAFRRDVCSDGIAASVARGPTFSSTLPLRDTAFNRCKSDLKFIEAAQARVVALASPTVYGETIENGRTGLIFHNPEDLKRHLRWLLANPQAARAMAEAARAYVIARRMQAYQLADRVAWYRSLWARRHALTHALLARMPELAAAEPGAIPADLGRVLHLPPLEGAAVDAG